MFRDPILYIIGFFVVVAFVTLFLNKIRDRKLIIEQAAIIFQHKFTRREIPLSEIEWFHIGRERSVRQREDFRSSCLKCKGGGDYKIRVGRYEREKELIAEMENVAARVPKGERRRIQGAKVRKKNRKEQIRDKRVRNKSKKNKK